MANPMSLDGLIFHVIRITAPEVRPVNWAIMATGKTESGENGLWVDDYCVYDEMATVVVEALESMVGKETKFWDAADFLYGEWISTDGKWIERDSVYP